MKEEEKIIEYGPASKKQSRTMLLTVGIAFFLTWGVMIAGAIYAKKHMETGVNGTEISDKISDIEERLESTSNSVNDLKDLKEIIKQLPENLPDQEIIPAKVEIKKLSERVNKLEERDQQLLKNDNTLNPLIVSMLNLRDHLQKYLPYEDDIQMLGKLVKDDDKLKKDYDDLVDAIAEGYTSIEKLREEFTPLADKIVQAAGVDKNSVWGKIKGTISDSVTVRKVDNTEGDGAEAVAARVEAELTKGKLKEAVDELKKLSGSAADVVENWLGRAENTLKVEDVFSRMYKRVGDISYENSPSAKKEQKTDEQTEVDDSSPEQDAVEPTDPAQ